MSGDYRLPAEWEPQKAIWLSWPCHPDSWPNRAEQVEAQFLDLASVISQWQTVCLNAAVAEHDRIREGLRRAGACLDRVELYAHANNDAWCRDRHSR